MAVTLSDEDYGRMMWALRRIACGVTYGHETGKRRVLSRPEAREIAREVCGHFGWSFLLTQMPAPNPKDSAG